MNGLGLGRILGELWMMTPAALAGSLVALVCVGVGWAMAGQRTSPGVGMLTYWLFEVVLPLLKHRLGLVRTTVIFVNNGCVCALLVSLGGWGIGGWIGVAVVGWGLGAGMRLLADPSREMEWRPPESVSGRRLAMIGVVLNLLELPAIVISVGLSLGQGEPWEVVEGGRAMALFLILVCPLLLLAAIGESLWLGVSGGLDEESGVDENSE